MSEYFKQFMQAWEDRVRSPFVGSIVISFVLINWKVLFYLLFADKPVRQRILYFEANTELMSLFIMPTLVGISAGLILPWLSFLSACIARSPKSKLDKLEFEGASNRRIAEFQQMGLERTEIAMLEAVEDQRKVKALQQKALEQDAIAEFEAAEELRKIGAAKRLEEAQSVSPNLAVELSKFRNSTLRHEPNKEILLRPITIQTVEEYSRALYPGLPISEFWQDALVKQIDHDNYDDIGAIHKAVMLAEQPIEEFARSEPNRFRHSTDYLTKSLGIIDRKFRYTHGFNSTTKDELIRLSEKYLGES